MWGIIFKNNNVPKSKLFVDKKNIEIGGGRRPTIQVYSMPIHYFTILNDIYNSRGCKYLHTSSNGNMTVISCVGITELI